MTFTSTRVEGQHVIVERRGGRFPPGDAEQGVVALTFAEVCAAAASLRAYAEAITPKDIPMLVPASKRPATDRAQHEHRSAKNHDPVVAEPAPSAEDYASTLEEAERDNPCRSGGHPDAYAQGLHDLVALLKGNA